jgi:hypothetical protein
MYDIFHEWGSDLTIDSSGDLALSAGSDSVSQRIFRRLLTNPGDYLWNLDYGGGLGQFVGATTNPAAIEASVRTQLLLEASIPPTPAPQVTARIVDPANGYVLATITYADPSTLQPIQLDVSIG